VAPGLLHHCRIECEWIKSILVQRNLHLPSIAPMIEDDDGAVRVTEDFRANSRYL
jgi:hypothetical protein